MPARATAGAIAVNVLCLMMGDAATAAVGSFACLLGSGIETGPGEAGERVYCCRGCVPHYLHYKFPTFLNK